jgi:hypothetical protein
MVTTKESEVKNYIQHKEQKESYSNLFETVADLV